jgi:hypothetical protein
MSAEKIGRVRKVVEMIRQDGKRGTVFKLVETWECDLLDKEVRKMIDALHKNLPPMALKTLERTHPEGTGPNGRGGAGFT